MKSSSVSAIVAGAKPILTDLLLTAAHGKELPLSSSKPKGSEAQQEQV